MINDHLVFALLKSCPRCDEEECGLTCSEDMEIYNYFIKTSEDNLSKIKDEN